MFLLEKSKYTEMSSDIPENNSIYINIGAEKSKFVLIFSPSITIIK
jgi:hypothetical protein